MGTGHRPEQCSPTGQRNVTPIIGPSKSQRQPCGGALPNPAKRRRRASGGPFSRRRASGEGERIGGDQADGGSRATGGDHEAMGPKWGSIVPPPATPKKNTNLPHPHINMGKVCLISSGSCPVVALCLHCGWGSVWCWRWPAFPGGWRADLGGGRRFARGGARPVGWGIPCHSIRSSLARRSSRGR